MFTTDRRGQGTAPSPGQGPTPPKEVGTVQAAVQEAALKAVIEFLGKQGPVGAASVKGIETLAQNLRDLRLGRESIDIGLRTLPEDARERRLEPASAATLQTFEKLDKMLNDFAARIQKKSKHTDLEQLFLEDAKNIRPVTENYRRYVEAKSKKSWAEAEKAAADTAAGWRVFQARHIELASPPGLSSTMRFLELPAKQK